MQSRSLLVTKFLELAEQNHKKVEIVSMLPEGGKITTNYGLVSQRSKKVAQALARLGINFGDRVGTLAWNTHRHMEIWYGASGMGAVTHTINPRLFSDQLVYIINHAEDRILFFDISFISLVEEIAPRLTSVEQYVIMTDKASMPTTSLDNFLFYEELIEQEDGQYQWPDFDENTACSLCYTSGTTGDPKGSLYSHRSNYLHAVASMGKDVFNIGAADCVMPLVPMFHANAWGIPYGATAAGSKLVMIGPHHDPETLCSLINEEGVTTTASVPTIFLSLLHYLEETGKGIGKLQNIIIGGAAAPRSMIERFKERYGVWVNHAWGMTEISPTGVVCRPNNLTINLSDQDVIDLRCKQGRGFIGIEMTIKDDEGNDLPWDGATRGNLMVRGPWVISQYYRDDRSILNDDNWFDTGDVATIDEHGYMQIVDRSKDVIKSGGEWISSIELENAAIGHPDIVEAAVIGIHHSKWGERPLVVAVLKDGASLDLSDLRDHLLPLVAKWWLPDGLEVVEDIPYTATGKISKKQLRERFANYQFGNE